MNSRLVVRIAALWVCAFLQLRAATDSVTEASFVFPSEMDSNCTVNAWTKPMSGHWEEPHWSCGKLPAVDQYLIAITNAGSKRVTIDWNTTGQFSNSLTLYNLVVDAPSGSANRLLLMYAGTNLPLTALGVTLGANGSLVSYASGLSAATFNVNSSALFAERSFLQGSHISVAGKLMLMNSSASAGLISVASNGVVNQLSGSCKADLVVMDAQSRFSLVGGRLSVEKLHLEYNGFPVQVRSGLATFVQAGGQMALDTMKVGTPVLSTGYRGEYLLQGGLLNCAEMDFYNGSFTQTHGANATEVIRLPAWQKSDGHYSLLGGTLVSGAISLGVAGTFWDPAGNGSFFQSGGVHTNGSMSLGAESIYLHRITFGGVRPLGHYSLYGGLLVSSDVAIAGGSFYQDGGSGRIQELRVGNSGTFTLGNGELHTSNTTVSSGSCGFNYDWFREVCLATTFMQEGGTHIVGNLAIGGVARYQLSAGKLTAENIVIGANSALNCETGKVRNLGMFTMAGGVFRAGQGSHRLGQLEVRETSGWARVPPEDASSVYVGESAQSLLRFRDSRDVPWSGARLQIRGWAAGSGRIYVGRDSLSLTADQLSKVVFVNPGGWPGGNYPAGLLSTGELLSAVPPPVSVTRGAGGLVLSWPGQYDLLCATNVMGPYLKVPGATSPVAIPCSAPQQYFRLVLPEPTAP